MAFVKKTNSVWYRTLFRQILIIGCHVSYDGFSFLFILKPMKLVDFIWDYFGLHYYFDFGFFSLPAGLSIVIAG